jgi:hypothetical protein
MQLTESMKDELRAMWARKRAAGRMVCEAAGDMRPDGGRGRAYHLDDLLNDIANHPARFAVRDTNIPEAHPPGPNAVTTPAGTNRKGIEEVIGHIAEAMAKIISDRGVAKEIATRAFAAEPKDAIWFCAGVVVNQGDNKALAALCQQFFNGGQSGQQGGGAAALAEPEPVSAMRNEGASEALLPKTQDAAPELESFVPKRNGESRSLTDVISNIKRKR